MAGYIFFSFLTFVALAAALCQNKNAPPNTNFDTFTSSRYGGIEGVQQNQGPDNTNPWSTKGKICSNQEYQNVGSRRPEPNGGNYQTNSPPQSRPGQDSLRPISPTREGVSHYSNQDVILNENQILSPSPDREHQFPTTISINNNNFQNPSLTGLNQGQGYGAYPQNQGSVGTSSAQQSHLPESSNVYRGAVSAPQSFSMGQGRPGHFDAQQSNNTPQQNGGSDKITFKMDNQHNPVPQVHEDDSNLHIAPLMDFSDYNRFAWDLFKNADSNYGLVLSPIVLAYQLLLFKEFSQNMTKRELERALGNANRRQIKSLVDVSKGPTTTQFELANGIFYENKLNVNADFKNVDGNFTKVEAFYPYKRIDSISTINKWTKKTTHEEIKELLDPNFPIDRVKMILTSAVYFKGSWKHRFNTSNEYGTFINYNNEGKFVPFMEIKNNIVLDRPSYHLNGRTIHLQVIQLPYDDETHAMLLLMPVDKNIRIGDLRNQFTSEKFHEIVDAISQTAAQRTTLKMPKFSVNSEILPVRALQAMNITKLFTDGAELTIADPPEKVSHIVQRSVIRVDEIGTTAASVAGAFLIPLSADSVVNREIVIDRPFLSIIYNIKNNAVLFISHITEVK